MTLEVADECTQKEIDVIGLGCSKESFTEHSEVEKLIDELRTLFVAQYEEYRPHLIQHLVDRKVIHWDTALHQMTFLDPESMKLILFTQILPRCSNPELYLRHGSILASGKVISALCQVAKDHQRRLPDELGDAAMESITQTCIDILEERFWRSFGGDQMRIAVCHFIQDLVRGVSCCWTL
ncbi:hypothetical protein DAPPUDRAFT_323024 [Daphnia pulex]|uniref:Tubulin-specific chaperone D C-terminal domain-containing protein n=1 Tax=Daphnia pulex TaxID=6669 RepID=E9GXQ1_DAPPU|nr:hypothetical protein DAPPUDRAFT_323024 [Daphnia pulex]|eukprot:EFX75777.1 hypothetical protein DAPPUDRAFT_323024 [Daphnia pulex]